jgi:sulfur-carrier protein adenylyltransferase/sulfurtransferase
MEPLAFNELIEQKRSGVEELTIEELDGLVNPLLIDVREDSEWAAGSIAGSEHVSRGVLESRVGGLSEADDRPIVLFCSTGNRSVLAADSLKSMGYSGVYSLIGGFDAWKASGRAVDRTASLQPAEASRYGRNLALPGVGTEGQRRIIDSSVAVVGAGGLGSPVLAYLAAAGVGTLKVFDHDVVEESNLQRQIIHESATVGRPKVESAVEAIMRLNPFVKAEPHSHAVNAENAIDALEGARLVVDCSDNFSARFAVNDAAIALKIPVVHASILEFEAFVSVFDPAQKGPCYRCLVPSEPPPAFAPNCSETGVLGAAVGVAGAIQAVEALKLLTGIGNPLTGRMLAYDVLEQSTRTFDVSPRPGCEACASLRR